MGRTKFNSKRRRRRRFFGNQYTSSDEQSSRIESKNTACLEDDKHGESQPVHELRPSLDDSFQSCASFDKLNDNNVVVPDEKAGVYGYRMIDLNILNSVFKLLCCPECQSEDLGLHEIGNQGSARNLQLKCSGCEWIHHFWTSNKTVNGGFDINRREVYAARSCGLGYSGLEKLHVLLNMPPPLTRKNYGTVSRSVLAASKSIAEESMAKAAEEIVSLGQADENGIVDSSVSCDGTWQKRGYSSLNGVFTAISTDSGKIVDVECMSRFCKICDRKKGQNESTVHVCRANYEGSAPNMEKAGAERVFGRSMAKNKMRYTQYYGDGDSKSFNAVEHIYKDRKVEKLECIGHVQKRVGKRLRDLKKKVKGLGGKGKLTNAIIDRLQNYYGIAVRSNVGNLEEMKKAIHASLFHVASSREQNWHQHCPDGEDSWCAFKADKASGKNQYKPGQGLPTEVVKHVKPIFQDLSNDDLLSKCLHGKTQNQNESFNAMIWNRLPKGTYVGFHQFQLGVYDAITHFNQGSLAVIETLKKMNLEPGRYTHVGCKKTNAARIANAQKHSTVKVKQRRRKLRGRRKKKEDCHKEKEGETYGYGCF